jgi:hypothetical protein
VAAGELGRLADLLWSRERNFYVDCAGSGRDFNVISEGHYCMVRDQLWRRELAMTEYFSGVLCLGCMERRLGRRLGLGDVALSRSYADRVFWPRGTLMLPKVWDAWTRGLHVYE